MFTATTLVQLVALLTAILCVRADPNPNNPGPGDVFTVGQPCPISWDPDLTAVWKTMQIDLMTGNNVNMVYLETVATVDGTDPTKTSFSYTCPEVNPHAAIYFYQFSSPATGNKTWTGRFAITDATQAVVAPSESTQPDGEQIPWGMGVLVGTNTSVSANNGSSSTTASAPTSSGAPKNTSSSLSFTTYASASPTSGVSVTTVTSSAVASPGANVNGAATTLPSATHILCRTVLALGVAAVGFAVMF